MHFELACMLVQACFVVECVSCSLLPYKFDIETVLETEEALKTMISFVRVSECVRSYTDGPNC